MQSQQHARKPLAERIEVQKAAQKVAIADGEPALLRLFEVAKSDSGQSRRIAAFLAGLYNGPRFPFDLTDLRGLDSELLDDALKVLRMDAVACEKEIHLYFDDGSARFEKMIEYHGL